MTMMKLTSPRTIDEILEKYGLHFNKRYGQNFLIDENVVKKIVEAGEVGASDWVLEIGPGIGTMTQELAQRASRVAAVEIDKKLVPVLHETLEDWDNVAVIQGDILKLNMAQELPDFYGHPFKVVSNLPYYVTTPIIMGFLESELPVERMTFLVQKEVGERICAAPGGKSYGALSIAAQFYAEPHVDFYVPSTVFMPRPNVDSVVISLTRREVPEDDPEKKAFFFRVVHGAFANRRKTLVNSLSMNLGCGRDVVTAALEQMGMDVRIRAESLTGENFAELAGLLEQAEAFKKE